jgi:hypothetical protein
MALLQGIKKLFGPLLNDLGCVSANKEAMELQEELEGGHCVQRYQLKSRPTQRRSLPALT